MMMKTEEGEKDIGKAKAGWKELNVYKKQRTRQKKKEDSKDSGRNKKITFLAILLSRMPVGGAHVA